MTTRAFNFNRLSNSLNREASNFYLSSHDNSSNTTLLYPIRPCCVIKHRNAFACFETCRVLFGQGVNTPVSDRLRHGIKLGLTWKHCHMNAGRSLWVGQGLLRTDRLCMAQSARVARPFRKRSGSSGTFPISPLLVTVFVAIAFQRGHPLVITASSQQVRKAPGSHQRANRWTGQAKLRLKFLQVAGSRLRLA